MRKLNQVPNAPSRNVLITFAIGLVCGFSFAYLFLRASQVSLISTSFAINGEHIHIKNPNDPHDHHDLEDAAGPKEAVSMHGHDEEFHKGKHDN